MKAILKQLATFSVVAAAAVLLIPARAKADTVNVTLTGVNGGIDAGVYTSPYYATVNSIANVLVVCDDFGHEDSIGQSWTATTSTMNNLSQVRFDGTQTTSQLQQYEEAAWLFDQLVQDPKSPQGGNISFAIWAIFTPSAENSAGFTTGPNSAASWLNAAENQTFWAGEFSNIEILTPTTSGSNSPQEFLTEVPAPEPSSLLLLGVGMLGTAIFLRWKSSSEAVEACTAQK